MPTSILATKLYTPSPRAKVVSRHRLFERLNNGLASSRKLTIISAPAGFGKTTVVSEWVAGCRRPTAWLSLDEGDNDRTRFLTYLVTALQIISPNFGPGYWVCFNLLSRRPNRFGENATVHEWLHVRSLYFPDPEGNLLVYVCYDASVG